MRHLLLLLLLPALLLPAAADTKDAESVVRVTAAYQEYDPFTPWQKRRPSVRSGFGVVIDAHHVLTTEQLARNHTLIEIWRARSGESIAAALVNADPQVNLALLYVSDATRLEGLAHPSLATGVEVNSEVEIVQIDETSGIQRGPGRVVKALVDGLPGAPYSALQFDVLTDLNVDGSGAPVYVDDSLAGIILSYSRATRTGKMLAAPFLSRFVEDAKNEIYGGFASAGFSWQPLVDPVKRTYLGVGDATGGIQILSCLPGTGSEQALKPNDVIMEWDGHSVDNLGFYDDPRYGRLLFPHLIKGLRRPGDKVPLTVVRNGTNLTLELTLTHMDEGSDLIPDDVTGSPQPYLVDGGLVICELTGRMLHAYGAHWQSRADPRLVHLYLTRQHAPGHPGDRIVMLTSVLPDPINIGYQHFHNQIIESVNGKPVRNIGDVFRIANHDGSVKRLSLRGIGVDLVLDQDALQEANRRIASLYRIPNLRRDVGPDTPPTPSQLRCSQVHER